MTITEFIDKLAGKGRERADAAIDVLAIGMLLLLFWYGINLVIVGWGNELTVLQIPMSSSTLACRSASPRSWSGPSTTSGRSCRARPGRNAERRSKAMLAGLLFLGFSCSR